MRKLLFILMLLPMLACAQRVDKPGETYDGYCVADPVYIDSSSEPSILIGDDEDKYICDDRDVRIKFKSRADFLTYMSKRGWIFVSNHGLYACIFKKTVKDDKEAFECLNLKTIKETKKK